MLKQTANSRNSITAPARLFTGKAWIDTLVNNDQLKCNIIKVSFEPAARNNWHSHPDGQILIGTEGKGYVQKRGEQIQVILPGDVVTIFADEDHWHGAAPDSLFSHLAVMPISDKPATDWHEPVTDEEYFTFNNNNVNPDYQLEVAQSRLNKPDWNTLSPEIFRNAQKNMVDIFGEAFPVKKVKDIVINQYNARFYQHTDNFNAPFLIYIHGGGFVRGSLDTHHVMLSYLASVSGINILSLEYPLSPENPYPKALNTLKKSVEEAILEFKTSGYNTDKVLIGGDSAAGNIVVALMHRLIKESEIRFAAQILIHPTLDASFSSNTYTLYEDGYVFTKAAAAFSFNHYLGSFTNRQHPEVSPLFIPDDDLKQFPYTIILQSHCDPCSDDSTRFFDRLRKNKINAFIKKYDGSIHNFMLHGPHRDLSRQAINDLASLMKSL